MTGLNTLTEYEVLEYAYMEIAGRVHEYEQKKAAAPEGAEFYDTAINGYNEKLEELEAAMAAALEKEEIRA